MASGFRNLARATFTAAIAAMLSFFSTPGTLAPLWWTYTSLPPAAASASDASDASDTTEVEVQRSIAEREYEATDTGGGLHVINRAHGLRTYVVPGGARVFDGDNEIELVRLRTVSVDGFEVGPGEVVASGTRLEVRRQEFVERFENSAAGLEHGWTISKRRSAPLSIVVDFDTDVRVEGDRAILAQLEYGGLVARDATGARLMAHMEQAGFDRLRILVDDTGAVYPVTVDPMLTRR